MQAAFSSPWRIGQAYDCHAFSPTRPLILGGVTIPHPLGLLGHSDADVLLHAITDALLGAAGLGDIGQHFPDTDPQFQGANSRHLLQATMIKIQAAGFAIGNIDSTIIAQAPKLAPYLPRMIAHLASDCVISPKQVNIKAKTNENMGFLGRQEGIAALAVVLLYVADDQNI